MGIAKVNQCMTQQIFGLREILADMFLFFPGFSFGVRAVPRHRNRAEEAHNNRAQAHNNRAEEAHNNRAEEAHSNRAEAHHNSAEAHNSQAEAAHTSRSANVCESKYYMLLPENLNDSNSLSKSGDKNSVRLK